MLRYRISPQFEVIRVRSEQARTTRCRSDNTCSRPLSQGLFGLGLTFHFVGLSFRAEDVTDRMAAAKQTHIVRTQYGPCLFLDLSAAFSLPFPDLPLPFLDLPLPCTSFSLPSLTFHCLSLTFRCLALPFLDFVTTFRYEARRFGAEVVYGEWQKSVNDFAER